MNVALYCLCGGSWVLTNVAPIPASAMVAEWYEIHHGDGHGDTDRRTCARNRRRNDEAAAREYA